MSTFVISTRALESDGSTFSTKIDPTTRYLTIPDDSASVSASQAVSRDGWIRDVYAATGDTGDLLFFVHGYNNSIAEVLVRHRKLEHGLKSLGFRGSLVSFDWPCGTTAINYLDDRTEAKITAMRLVSDGIRLFVASARPGCRVNIHLLGHSTGAYVIREGFEHADHTRSIARDWTVSQLMFVAGDISSRSLREDDPRSESLFLHGQRITNYYNPFDAVLEVSNVKRLGAAPRVGRAGLPEDTHGKCVDVNCGDRFKRVRRPDPAWGHSWYFGDEKSPDADPVFLRDLFHTITGAVEAEHIETRMQGDKELALMAAEL